MVKCVNGTGSNSASLRVDMEVPAQRHTGNLLQPVDKKIPSYPCNTCFLNWVDVLFYGKLFITELLLVYLFLCSFFFFTSDAFKIQKSALRENSAA